MTQTLQTLLKAERTAWTRKMRGSEADASTIYGQEGVNELAWRKAAEACFAYRQQHNLIGVRVSLT